MPASNHIFSVSALTQAIKGNIESAFPFVWVQGQVTNVTRPLSGHIYFSLRDKDATLPMVWFKGQHTVGERFDPLTGEVFDNGPRQSLAATLENGQEIVCAGRLTVYPPRGGYQLVVELAEDAGLGKLQAEFELLRAKLAQLGYFALERKRMLPFMPRKVSVVTSPKGAAVHDFLRIADSRGVGATISIHPVPVQGEMAASLIAKAIRRINDAEESDVIVIVRGGGSLEDLHAFNTEQVAEAVFSSKLPVLAGVGHEIDYTLADMTADVRAATPTHAAQLLWPEKKDLQKQLDHVEAMLGQALDRKWEKVTEHMAHLSTALEWKSPQNRLILWQERVNHFNLRIRQGFAVHIHHNENKLSTIQLLLEQNKAERLKSASAKLRTLIASFNQSGISQLAPFEKKLHDISLGLAQAEYSLFPKKRELDLLKNQIALLSEKQINFAEHELEKTFLQLEGLDPLAPLKKGYALLTRANGALLTSTKDAKPHDSLIVTVHDGSLDVKIIGVTSNEQ